ncbi:MAG: SRPBCC domain-containing protein [Myxococcales bacterium]|nr:SRPBCC domain-containing protein [Myxococcales bacterium]
MLGLRTAIHPVADLAAARDWYAKLLEITPYFDQPFYVGFDVGGYELGLVPAEDDRCASPYGVEALWGVADLDAVYWRAVELGATPIEAPHEVGGDIRVASVIDPAGNRLGLIFNPHFAVPARGAVTISDPPATTLGAPDGALADVDLVWTRALSAPRAAVWAAWSSAEGLAAWFADEVRMELRIGGPFEILFFGPEVAERGSEGSKVLAFVPGRLLAFSWNAPPHLKHTRPQLTWVTVELADADGGTALTLTHTGWPAAGFEAGGHPDWPATHAYFKAAWPRVLDALAAHLGAPAA